MVFVKIGNKNFPLPDAINIDRRENTEYHKTRESIVRIAFWGSDNPALLQLLDYEQNIERILVLNKVTFTDAKGYVFTMRNAVVNITDYAYDCMVELESFLSETTERRVKLMSNIPMPL